MFLIKVQYFAYKNPRWVITDPDCPEHVKAIQKSRKTAAQFKTREEAEKVAETLQRGCTVNHSQVEIVPYF